MKKLVCAAAAVMLMFLLQTACAASWTLAVYMTPGDLEESYGLATNDLQELCTPADDVDVYVCTGGTQAWQMSGIPADEVVVWKIQKGAMEKLASLGSVSMGDPETLERFLAFLPQNDQKNMLVFSDHGAGPVEGLCFDQLHDDDGLVPAEIGQALQNGPKFELIAADCCVSSHRELLSALKTSCSFALLSEENVPAQGFDYASVLSLLAASENGADAAKAVADYAMDSWLKQFEAFPEFAPAYALGVFDAAKLGRMESALDGLLARMNESLSLGGFPFQSRLRETVIREAGRYSRAERIDAVDVASLAEAYAELFPQESRALLEALDELTIHCRTNAEGLHGLSMYLPQSTKLYETASHVLEQAAGAYARSYMQYRMAAQDSPFEEPFLPESAGTEIVFALDETQLDRFSKASVLIYGKQDDAYALLTGAGGICPDEQGVLRYSFEDRALFLTAADGSCALVPLFDLRREDGVDRARSHAILMGTAEDGSYEPGSVKNVTLDIAYTDTDAQIAGIDYGAGGRNGIRLDDFGEIVFSGGGFLPATDENGRALPFKHWTYSPQITISVLPIDGLQLSFLPYPQETELFAQFQIEDIYGAVHASEIIPLQ